VESAKAWAKEAVVLAGIMGKQKAKEPDSEYQARIDAEATKLILGLKVCDPACGSASFLVAALHYLSSTRKPSTSRPSTRNW
jgi:hypothetical protein